MSPPTQFNGINVHSKTTVNAKIIPTFLSTDLVTPGKARRSTLPALGVHTRPLDDEKLWGQETKESDNGRLAYHHFKPSHFDGKNVVVTHRHFDNRINHNVAKDQPCVVTTLLLSKCRLNDQRMPQPLDSDAVDTHFIKEPISEDLRNSHFAHRCQHQVFPTSGVDRKSPASENKEAYLTKHTIKDMESIERHLYGTTTYQQHFQMKRRKSRKNVTTRCVCKQPKSHSKGYRSTKNCRLTNAKIGKNQLMARNVRIASIDTTCNKCMNQVGTKQLEKTTSSAKIKSTKSIMARKTQQKKEMIHSEFPVWPSYPPGNNITNNPPNYPRVIIPKYCLHMHSKKTSENECACKEYFSPLRPEKQRVKNKKEIITETQVEENAESSSSEDEDEQEEEDDGCVKENEPLLVKREKINSLSPIRSSHKRTGRGFKTDAHHRFHAKHRNVGPDLRDAAKEGKRHNFFGYNAYVFRG